MHPMSKTHKLPDKNTLLAEKKQRRCTVSKKNTHHQNQTSAPHNATATSSIFMPPELPIRADWSDPNYDPGEIYNNNNINGQNYDIMRTFLKGTNWQSPYLILPNISFSQMNLDRFSPFMNEDCSLIRLINRYEIVQTLIEKYTENSYNTSLYLFGPSGCGKSFMMFHMACKLMCSENNVVVYVNKASQTMVADIISMLKTRYYFFFFYFTIGLYTILTHKFY
jgi:hypothetical protein